MVVARPREVVPVEGDDRERHSPRLERVHDGGPRRVVEDPVDDKALLAPVERRLVVEDEAQVCERLAVRVARDQVVADDPRQDEGVGGGVDLGLMGGVARGRADMAPASAAIQERRVPLAEERPDAITQRSHEARSRFLCDTLARKVETGLPSPAARRSLNSPKPYRYAGSGHRPFGRGPRRPSSSACQGYARTGSTCSSIALTTRSI